MLIDAAYKGEVRTCIVTPINMLVIVVLSAPMDVPTRAHTGLNANTASARYMPISG